MFRSSILVLSLLSVLFFAPAVHAQAQSEAADHEQLRALLTSLQADVNAKNVDNIQNYFYDDFSATMVTQDLLTSRGDIQEFFDKWFSGEDALIQDYAMAPEVDELTQIIDGKFGIARGSNTETYGLSTGNDFTLTSRWTASVIKDQGQWKVVALHSGINFIDNPVLAAAGSATTYFAGGGLVVGLLLGLFLGWFFRFART